MDCGPGTDTSLADGGDTVTNCETKSAGGVLGESTAACETSRCTPKVSARAKARDKSGDKVSFSLVGKVLSPKGVDCSGRVRIEIFADGDRILSKKPKTTGSTRVCRFKLKRTLKNVSDDLEKLTVKARFHGNDDLTSRKAKSRTLTIK